MGPLRGVPLLLKAGNQQLFLPTCHRLPIRHQRDLDVAASSKPQQAGDRLRDVKPSLGNGLTPYHPTTWRNPTASRESAGRLAA